MVPSSGKGSVSDEPMSFRRTSNSDLSDIGNDTVLPPRKGSVGTGEMGLEVISSVRSVVGELWSSNSKGSGDEMPAPKSVEVVATIGQGFSGVKGTQKGSESEELEKSPLIKRSFT